VVLEDDHEDMIELRYAVSPTGGLASRRSRRTCREREGHCQAEQIGSHRNILLIVRRARSAWLGPIERQRGARPAESSSPPSRHIRGRPRPFELLPCIEHPLCEAAVNTSCPAPRLVGAGLSPRARYQASVTARRLIGEVSASVGYGLAGAFHRGGRVKSSASTPSRAARPSPPRCAGASSLTAREL
jgi:hypothetical protein